MNEDANSSPQKHDSKKGIVLWFTGISGAGKSTLAQKLYDELRSSGTAVEFLDGNSVREFFDNDLGFSPEDRHMAIKRSTYGAWLLAKNGVIVLVASLAARHENREFIREKLSPNYLQIWVKASVESVVERDPRGLYKAHKSGEMKELPGLDQEYQAPRNPSLVLETDGKSVEQSYSELRLYLQEQGILDRED